MLDTAQTGFTNAAEIAAFEKPPLSEHNLPRSTYEALQRGAALDPNAPALSFFLKGGDYARAKTISHGDLLAKVTQTANAFRKLGMGREDVVAYVLPNLPETHYTIWGASAAARVLAINPLLEPAQIADLLRTANAKVLVTLEKTPKADLWEKCCAAIETVPSVEHVITCSVFDWMDGALGAGLRLASHLRPKTLKLETRAVPVKRFNQLIRNAPADRLTFDAPEPDDISTMLCTGGTTGLPKIALRSHASEVYDAWALSHFNPIISAQGTAVLCGLPLFHSNAILVTGLLVFMSGGHVVLSTPQGYRGDGVFPNFWKIVDHFRIATFSGVPTVYAALLDVPRDGLDISSVQFGACGAAPMPVELFNRFVSETGIPIVEGYGLTEGAVASSLNPTHPEGGARIGSIGLRLPYQDMRVAILDDGDVFVRWAETDEAGVIVISGPNVFEGYLIDAQNDGIWLDQDRRRWFNTGDLARQDADGYFWMTGRKKELIIRGGHNIDPKIVEEAMHKHPAVAMAAVVGRPDAKVGEVPVMYFEQVPGAQVSTAELAEFAQHHVPERAAIPKDFIRVEALPVTAVGKIHKVTLNMMEINRTIQDEARKADVVLSVEVVQDPKRGIVSQVAHVSDRAKLQNALSPYPFNIDWR
ncbi:MAG: acyl-CoA synthetase [Pelagimonas sp.]|jgi:fatty-acyl-CoA synthase|nr:acyl-CoA synthetase [Pelagimonas sp.]